MRLSHRLSTARRGRWPSSAGTPVSRLEAAVSTVSLEHEPSSGGNSGNKGGRAID